MKKRVLSILLVLVMLVSVIPASAISVFAADDETSLVIVNQNSPQNPISTLTLMPGDMTNLKACIRHPDGTLERINFGVNWKSSVQEIARVSTAGMVTAQNEGIAEIYAIYSASDGSDLMATITVKVGILGEEVILEPVDEQGNVCYSKDVFVGDSFNLRVNAYENGEYIENVPVEWRIDEIGILENYGDGFFKALQPGTAFVKALYMSNDGFEYPVDIQINVSDIPLEENAVVKSVSVKLEGVPQVGSTPFYDATIEATGCTLFTPDDPTYNGYVQNGIMWIDVTNSPSTKMSPTDTFEEDHTYSIAIFLLADEGYSVTWMETQVTFNKKGASNTDFLDGYSETEAFIKYAVHAYTVNEKEDICTFDLKNCYATDSQGNLITSAKPGDTVRIVKRSPSLNHTFNGWIVEPANLAYTTENINVITFTAINGTVSITADYEAMACNYIYVYTGHDFIVGDEIPFTVQTNNGEIYHSGYHIGAPAEMVTSNMYNYVEWYDNTDFEYKKPGDVFEAGHTYSLYVSVIADDYYYFPENNIVTVKFGGIGDGIVYDYFPYGQVDASKYTQIGIGDIKPIMEYAINTKNAIAYADNTNNAITKAKAGDSVRVAISAPFAAHGDFKGWIIEPANLEYTTKNGMLYFTMPESDVSFTADYDTVEMTNVFVGIGGPFYAGDEIPYNFTTIDGNLWYSGYMEGSPEGFEGEGFYNHMSWFDMSDCEYAKPGDVFEDGHEYVLTVNIMADEYVHFTAANLMNVSFGRHGNAVSVGTYEGTDDSKYIYATSDGIKTFKAYSIDQKNCIARNEAGEAITSALPGDQISVVISAPFDLHGDFLGWNVEPYDLEYTIQYGVLKFTMPYDDVKITADYDKTVCNYVYFDLGSEFKVGQEIPFTVNILDGQIIHGGYAFKAHWDADYKNAYDYMSWLDTTTGEYMEPGDKFKADHTYKAFVYITPTEYCYFDSIENMRLKVGYINGEPVTTAQFNAYGSADPTQWLCVTIDDIATVPQNKINITNGTAYNADGEVITAAYPGDVVTVIAGDPTGVQTFNGWHDSDYMGDIAFSNNSSETTTFVMPERNVNIEAGFTPCGITDISFALDGYYQTNRSDKMDLSVSGNGFYVVPYDEYTPYQIRLDNYGQPNSFAFDGRFYYAYYWLCVELRAKDGYVFSIEDGETTVAVNGKVIADSIIEYSNDGKSVVIYYMIEAPEYIATNSIYVSGGIATQYGDEVTEAVPGSKIYLIPNENTDDAIFDKWVSSDVELITTDDGFTYFIMPDYYVSFEAKYKGAIYTIYINDIDFPAAGERPDYTATVYPEDGYSIILRDDYGWINGVSWWETIDQSSATKLDPDTAVFEEGKTYSVSFCIEALEGYWFPVNWEGAPTVQAFINGTYASVSMYEDDGSKFVSVSIEYTVHKSYSITIDGGKAYDPRGSATGSPTGGDGDPITSAYPGTYVKIVADVPEGYAFHCWNIIEGQIKVASEDLFYESFTFFMPEGDVVISAQFHHQDHEIVRYEADNDQHWGICYCGTVIPESWAYHEWTEEGTCYCGAIGHGVRFCWDDGSDIFGVMILDGNLCTEPFSPAQEGKIFLGWFDEDGNKYYFQKPVYEDMILKAIFIDASEIVLGDANGDGTVNGSDSLMAKRIAAGIDTPTPEQEASLDVNGDGKVNFTDTNLISRYIANVIIEFPKSN